MYDLTVFGRRVFTQYDFYYVLLIKKLWKYRFSFSHIVSTAFFVCGGGGN